MVSPSAIPGNESSASLISSTELEEVNPTRLIVSVLLVILAADWLLFRVRTPGLALSIFALICGGTILWNRRGWTRDRGLLWAAPVFLFSVIQAAVAFSWLNLLVLFVLLTLLAGTRFELPWLQRWPGWLEALVAWHKAPTQWARANAILRTAREASQEGSGPGHWRRAGQIVLPGLVLLIVFGAFLGAGNAMAGKYLGQIWQGLADYVRAFTNITPLRILFWIAMATIALSLCYPGRCGRFVRSCTGDWRRFSLSSDRQVSLWQTWISLAALNALYLFVNSLDVLYLWMETELPDGVSYSSFVHEGVFALIASTILAGLVISFFFQQSTEVGRSKLARALAVAWIAQNLLLLSGMVLRLHLYVDAFGWSVLRFHVGSFLVLTTAGFGLLTVYVIKGQTLRWLVLTNLKAVFALIYLLQFANVNGWVARWNVERWLADEQTNLDVNYLQELGPAAWPALKRAADEGSTGGRTSAEAALEYARMETEWNASHQTWQSWQWRYMHWKRALAASD